MMNDNAADEKPAKVAGVVDYTGVAAKSDPAEIKLVRKLDFRIMASLLTELCYCPLKIDRIANPQYSQSSGSCTSSTTSTGTPSRRLVSTTWRGIWACPGGNSTPASACK